MNLGATVRNRIKQAGWTLMHGFRQRFRGVSLGPNEGQQVLAVTNCYPTKIVLYAAAFQGGWKVHFMKSLREAIEAAHSQRPKAVFYDHHVGDPAWNQYCSSLAREGVPFVLLTHQTDDETLLVVLASGGYQTWGDPLTSEEVVKAVDFASEVAGLDQVPVMQG